MCPAYRATLHYLTDRFDPKYQVTPATTCIEAKASAVLESSEALNGAAAVTIPNTRPMIGDLDRKACDFFPMREAMNAVTTSPNNVEAKTIGRAIS